MIENFEKEGATQTHDIDELNGPAEEMDLEKLEIIPGPGKTCLEATLTCHWFDLRISLR